MAPLYTSRLIEGFSCPARWASSAATTPEWCQIVADRLLPHTQGGGLGTSHNGFGKRLGSRCAELGLLPPDLLKRIQELRVRIKDPRDDIVHAGARRLMSYRVVTAGPDLTVGTRDVVQSGEEAFEMRFETASTLRAEIHAYVRAMLEFLESACAT